MSAKFEEDLSLATHKKHTIKFKIVFIGDQAVGKSSIINRFIKNQFDSTHNPTVGIDFVSKNVNINERAVRLQLWDTAGQQRFRSLIPGYLRDSHAIFLVYDVTHHETFENVNTWIDYIKEHRGEDVIIFIVGNKIDLAEERTVSFDESAQKFKQIGGHYIEVSAKTGENLEQLFNQACECLLQSNQVETSQSQTSKPRERKESQKITGEKEYPNKKQTPIESKSNKSSQPMQLKEGAMRGSKLVKSNNDGKSGRVIREKNCC